MRKNSPEEGDNEKHSRYFWEKDLNQREMYVCLIQGIVFCTENAAPLFSQLNRVIYHLENDVIQELLPWGSMDRLVEDSQTF